MTRAPILPPLTRTAADAEAVARIVHAGQVDQAGRPYIEHVERVAGKVGWRAHLATGIDREAAKECDEALQIAWLHDVLQPDERLFRRLVSSDLLNEGFSWPVVEGVARLTRANSSAGIGKTYAEYITAIAENAPLLALLVKLADLEDNSDPARLALLPASKAASLSKRYEPAKAAIRAAVEERVGGKGRRP